jgi:hypothetical protein
MGDTAEATAWLGCSEGGGGFQLYGSGKEDVVFQVHVLAKVVLELLEAGVEDAIAEADAEGRGEGVAELADLREQAAGIFVVMGEDGDGLGEEAIAADGVLVGRGEGALEADASLARCSMISVSSWERVAWMAASSGWTSPWRARTLAESSRRRGSSRRA